MKSYFPKILIIIIVIFFLGGGIFFWRHSVTPKVDLFSEKTESDEIVQEFTYTKNDQMFLVSKEEFNILDYFNPSELENNSRDCDVNKDKQYFENLLSNFSKNDKGIEYRFHYIPENKNYNILSFVVVPNKIGYTNFHEFKLDFDLCFAGGKKYPFLISNDYLLFISSCGTGALGEGCYEIKKFVEPTVELK